ncbi:MAG TPA: TonB-dependent siderophore receptor [Ottowia sp.]|uniref:TonB-dependent receptor n=1 Tax=Ottowia sp. TaxID=1898956 RepID=UPI002BACB7BF|nr:TonB-dependent siderophore receptor [Ottowia sp.]HMN21245.1 TonB-dependent siderophore receptor [Ottowia sp.]
MLLAGSLGSPAFAQGTATAEPASSVAGTLGTVTVQDTVLGAPSTSKTQLRATRTEIGKGNQELRDIPQSVTVMTEKLIQDRNLDDFREVLRATAGVTFQAGETGEEDVRLRGFSLGQAGDIYRDGMRDAPLHERDTFDDDRVEIIKGSASMLFGKGSTGGVVNQVSKQPFLMTQHEASATLGTGSLKRVQGDFNWQTGPDAAFRLNLLGHDASNWGAWQRKLGVAPTFRWGIGTRDEFSVGLYALDVKGRPNYAHPWLLGGEAGDASRSIIPTLPAKNFYGLAGDHLDTSATYATLGHVHRLAGGGELKTRLRAGRYKRDLLGSPIGFQAPRPTALSDITGSTVLTRSSKGRIGESDILMLQSDYSNRHGWGGMEHELLAGFDVFDESAKRNNSYANPAPRPNTTVGTPNDGAWVPDTRPPLAFNRFRSRSIGAYLQDTAALTDTVKLVAGLRFDHFKGSYRNADGTLSNERSDNLWSPRLGLLYQPDDVSSYYLSYGTSFNTSGDAYQFGVSVNANTGRSAKTPPEKSRNIELGGKWDLLDKRVLAGVALFYSQKYNERNTDPDTAAAQELLSGERHAAGMEFNLAGRVTPAWELFWNHTWIPAAKIDKSNVVMNPAGTGAQVQGDRPGLTPRHSGSVWTTYRVLPELRLGLGANYRSSQNPEGQRSYRARGFVTFDAMAEYSFSELYSLRLNVTNLTNKLYADTLYRGFYQPGAPRRVELTFKALF